VGEMRDLESIAITITLAETGHLVFATLHTNDSAQTMDRIIDVFPPERRHQIQIQLSATLQGVLSQRLLPVPGGGRVAAFEVLLATEAVRNLVREGKTRQLRNVISTSRNVGMQTLENDLTRLVASGLINYKDAEAISLYPREIQVQGPVPGHMAPLYDPFGRTKRPQPVPAHIR
jgi:twitching motility protein PilT